VTTGLKDKHSMRHLFYLWTGKGRSRRWG